MATSDPTTARRALLAGAAALPALATPAQAADAPDAPLLHLAAQLRATETDYAAAVAADNDEAITAAGDRLEDLIAELADMPAAGLAGVAAKAGRLTSSIIAGGGTSIMVAEAALVESLDRDLARLVPAAVPAVTQAFVPVEPAPDALTSPANEWSRRADAERERLAALGLVREGGGFTSGEVQVVGWLLRRIEARWGRGMAEAVWELSTIPASDFDPDWRTCADYCAAGRAQEFIADYFGKGAVQDS